MQARHRLANYIAPVFQVGVSGVLLFVSYRYLLHKLGAKELGVWSIALAVSSVSRIGEFGIASGVVKYVAQYLAQGKSKAAAELTQTAVLTMAIFLGGVLILFYPILSHNLGRFTATNQENFSAILPEVFLSLWMSSIASVFSAALSGCHRVDWSNYLTVAANIVNVTGVFMLVPVHGLVGVAYAQLLQMSFTLIGGIVLLRLALPEMPVMPVFWKSLYFKELMSYGAVFQLTVILNMFLEPMTKVLIGRYGGLEMAGYFEMANKVVMTLRSVITSSIQILVPYVANANESSPDNVSKLFLKTHELLLFISLLYFSGILISIPFINELWVGKCQDDFVEYAAILTICWFFNTVAMPAYNFNLGTGHLRWNAMGYLVMSITAPVLGIILGKIMGGVGVVLSFSIAMVAGAMVMLVAFCHAYDIRLSKLFPKENLLISIVSILLIALDLHNYIRLGRATDPLHSQILLFIFSSVVIIGVSARHSQWPKVKAIVGVAA